MVERIAQDMGIPDEVQNELLPSGEPRFRNQVRWARAYLAWEGLLDSSKRGVWSLTERGRAKKLSEDEASEIYQRWKRFPQVQGRAGTGSAAAAEIQAPEAPIEESDDHCHGVLELLRQLPASGFERFSQRLLREAGFTEVVVTGKSGDGGIDGHGRIQLNTMVSIRVVFQCKKYSRSVSAPELRDFRGSMAGRTDKGVFLTTGTFTAEARREASRDGVPHIELVDGERIARMLAELRLGLKPVTTYRVDSSFFKEFQS